MSILSINNNTLRDSDGNYIKIKVLYGTFPATADDFSISHGLSSTDTVIGLSIGSEYNGEVGSSTVQYMPQGFTDSTSFEYYAYVNTSSVTIRQTSSANLQNRPFRATIWYI